MNAIDCKKASVPESAILEHDGHLADCSEGLKIVKFNTSLCRATFHIVADARTF
jgi:hypothetical protein